MAAARPTATATAAPRPPARGRLWLLLALLLFSLGAALTALYQKPDAPPPRVVLPRGMDEAARERLAARRVRLADGPATAATDDDHRAPAPRDPMMAALPAKVKRAAIVIEANAIRYSPVGEMLMACLDRDGSGGFASFKKQSGLDPGKDIDRVAYVDDSLIVSGFFGDARWQAMFPESKPQKLDADTVLWNVDGEGEGDDGEDRRGGPPIAVWKNQMVIVGQNREALEETVARLRNGGPPDGAEPLIADDEAYGEIYGALSPDMLTEMLAGGQPDLAARLRDAAEDIRLHVDASHDVGIVAEVRGKQAAETQDLAKALGAAMVLGRLQAKSAGDEALASALDFAAIRPSGDAAFAVEAGLPLALFERALGDCARRKPDAAAGPLH